MFTSTASRLNTVGASADRGDSPESAMADDIEAVAHARAITRASGSSFYWAMRVLRRDRREAMFAIYAFCREVDDIADGAGSRAEKLRLLEQWRGDIQSLYDPSPDRNPKRLTARALRDPVRRFDLGMDDFLAVIDGMEMDVRDGFVAPSAAELETYCRRVAGAVGLLSIRAFGATHARAEEFAIALGSALQLTNILRDLAQDAGVGRLYLPRELLQSHAIATREPDEVLAHPALPEVCRALSLEARRHFDHAENALADCPGRALRPAVVMMMIYQRILDRLIEGGWRDLDRTVGISKPAKIWIATRYGLL